MFKRKLDDGQIFFLKISGFFIVIIVVNVVFVTLALRSHSGLVTDHAYEKGLAYNDILDQARAQETLGWQVGVVVADRALLLTLKDAAGAPINDAQVTLSLSRAVHDHEDRTLPTAELGAGQYNAPLPPEVSGYWKLRADIKQGDTAFQFHQDIMVK